MKRAPASIRVAAINLSILLALALGAELIFGDWFRAIPPLPLNILRHYDVAMDVSAVYRHDGPARYRRDGLGLRGAYGRVEDIDIVTIGGSTTDQRYIGEGETWQDALADALREHGWPAHIANAGVDGQSTIGHLAALQQWLKPIPALRPSYVVLYVGINDVAVDTERVNDKLEGEGAWPRLQSEVISRSALWRLYRTARGMLAARFAKLGHGAGREELNHLQWMAAAESVPDAALRRRLDDYAARLEKLDAAIAAWEATPVYVTQPRVDYRHDPADGMVAAVGGDGRPLLSAVEMAHFNRTLMQVCRQRNRVCIDLAADLPLEASDFYDFVHNTPTGARKIGGFLADSLFQARRGQPKGH